MVQEAAIGAFNWCVYNINIDQSNAVFRTIELHCTNWKQIPRVIISALLFY